VSDALLVSFEFGGRLALDLTWTLRFRAVFPTELLGSPQRLTEWVDVAGFPSGPVDENLLRAARQLREAIYRAASDTIDGVALRRPDLTSIDGPRSRRCRYGCALTEANSSSAIAATRFLLRSPQLPATPSRCWPPTTVACGDVMVPDVRCSFTTRRGQVHGDGASRNDAVTRSMRRPTVPASRSNFVTESLV
jgi:Putative stress-induced transcription regulator